MSSAQQNYHLKDKNIEELYEDLIESNNWTENEKSLVVSAYEFVSELFQKDLYKDQPYIYHLLRVANRITKYLHIKDAELVAAALLHDSVEDHFQDLAKSDYQDPIIQRQIAFQYLSSRFTPRISNVVALVTNKYEEEGSISKEQKIANYTEKVYEAVQSSDGWVIKFSDWCDNGLGIGFGAELINEEQISYFLHKYGGKVMEILEERYHSQDLQDKLDMIAKDYVDHQFALGHSRLPDIQSIAAEKHKHSHFSLFNLLCPEDD